MSENHSTDAPTDAPADSPAAATVAEATIAEPTVAEPETPAEPAPAAPAAESDAASLLKKAGLQFLGAVAAAIVAAGWSLKVVEDGGRIPYYIFILPVLLFVGAFKSYRGALTLGGKVKAPILAVAAVAAVVAVAAVGYSAKAAILDGPQVNSCWHDESETEVVQVSCDSEKADWITTREVTDPAECDSIGADGKYFCIEPK